MIFYLLIILIIITLFIPDGRENFIVGFVKTNVLTKKKIDSMITAKSK